LSWQRPESTAPKMVICEIGDHFANFALTYCVLCVAAILSIFMFSGSLFHWFYMNPSYEKWITKTNPIYPSAKMVRSEIFHMAKGATVGVICPTTSLWMSAHGYFQGYCGMKYGLGYEIFTFMFIWIFVDFYEWAYHQLGHTKPFFWLQHKSHHKFFNPTPFAVIADDFVDQFVRSLPLVFLPLMMPINMDLMFAEFVFFFYGYGIYLHWGHEFDWPDAHHPYINSAYHHYLHHAKSGATNPYHTGFFLKCWDNWMDTVWKKDCFCVKCQRKNGERTREIWDKTEKPDYSILFSPSFWVPYLFGCEKKGKVSKPDTIEGGAAVKAKTG